MSTLTYTTNFSKNLGQCNNTNIENVPALKLKNNEDFANAEMCNICKQPFNQQRGVNRHHWYILSHAAESVRIPFAGNAVVKRSTTSVPATFAS